MTAFLYDEVVTVAPVPALKVVRDGDTLHDTIQDQAPKKATLRVDNTPGDPLVDGATRLLSIALRHVYAALWRVGVLEVRA